MRVPRLALVVATFVLLACPLAASAHTGQDGGLHHGFLTGFLHPLTGADHLAAMLAVGLWSALTARRAWPDLLWAPLGFAVMLCVGAGFGLAGITLPAVEPMIAASLLVLGLLVLTNWRMPPLAAAGVAGVFALFHGGAHGRELAGESDALLTLAGMLCATVLLHGIGVAIGFAQRGAPRWMPRAAGAAVAMLGAALPLMR